MTNTKYLPPVPTLASNEAIAMFAENLRKDSRVSNGFQVKDLMSVNDGKVDLIDEYDANQDDALIVEPDGTFAARVSQLSSGLRNNFILAHELGHYVMHWPKLKEQFPGVGMKCPRLEDKADKNLTICDKEASIFAISFLLPEKDFRDSIKSYGIKDTAARFAVTPHLAEQRARSLGIAVEVEIRV